MDKSERVLLPTNVSPLHYDLELTPDLDKLSFSAVEKIKVLVSTSTTEIKLHSKEIQIVSASFLDSATSTNIEVEEIAYLIKETVVVLSFGNPLPAGEGVLSINFTGILNGDMAGFYKSSYSDADGKKKIMASTQFEALDARRAFPCWDEPLRKATFSVTLIVEKHLTAISNMPELSIQHLSNNKKKITFDISPLMSTYLLAWAIGEFDFIHGQSASGVTIRVFSPPGRAQEGKFALDVAKRALDFYNNFFQLHYPLPKLDMLCVTEFAAGAMENWGLVTYREVDLMIDEQKASSQQKQRVAIVVTHELAHQWFGNLVTMEWWDDLWLNEGFACYMEHLATDALFPDYSIWQQYTTDAMGAALRLDSLRSSHPIQVPIRHAEEVEQVFDSISYCKGSTVVRMVATILGPEKFREGLQLYMNRHKYSNTVTNHLWTAWSDVSGIDIPAIMSSWTSQMGFPYLVITNEIWNDNKVQFTLEQNWFLSDGSGSQDSEDSKRRWSIPLLFSTTSSSSTEAVIMTEKSQTFEVSLSSASDWVKINAGQKALVRVAHSQEMNQRLQAAIRSKSLSAIDRASLLLDAYALAKAGLGAVEAVVELLRGYEDEDSSTVWEAIEGVLGGLKLLMEQVGGEAYAAYLAFAIRIIKSAFQKIGWSTAAGVEESHTDKLRRSSILRLVESYCGYESDIVQEARRKFEAHWSDPTELPSDYKSIIYRIVLQNADGVTEYEQILASFRATEDNTTRKFAMNTLGAAKDTKLKLRTLDWALNGTDVKLQDIFYPLRSVSDSSLLGSSLCWSFFKENVSVFKSKLSKASPSLMDACILSAVSRFCTLEQAEELSSFFAAHPIPSSERRISQTVEAIRNNGAMLLRMKDSKLSEGSFWK